MFIAKVKKRNEKKKKKKEFAISTYMRKRRAKPLTIETSVTELMLKTYVARTLADSEIEGHRERLEHQETRNSGKRQKEKEKHEKYERMKQGPAENMTVAV